MEGMKPIIALLAGDQPGRPISLLSAKSSEELRQVADILPLVVDGFNKIPDRDEQSQVFLVLSKLVHKDIAWGTKLANSRFFLDLKSYLEKLKTKINQAELESICLLVNSVTFQNPLAKNRLVDLQFCEQVFAILRDKQHPIYSSNSPNNKWKLPALKILNNCQFWTKDFKYDDEFCESFYNIVKSFEDQKTSQTSIEDPVQVSSVIFNILKSMIYSPSFKNLKSNRLARLIDIGLYLSDDDQTTADCINCIGNIRKRVDILFSSSADDFAIIIDSIANRCSAKPKLIASFCAELSVLAEVVRNSKNRSNYFPSSTLDMLLEFLKEESSEFASIREVLKLFSTLAKLEYLDILQRHEFVLFEALESLLARKQDPSVITELHNVLCMMSKLSMNYNEKISQMVIPLVIQHARDNWQDRVLVLRAMELINSILASVDINCLLQDNLLMVLAKCLEVWRFDIAVSEIILTILNSLPLEQWDVREELNKLNFIQTVNAISMSTEGKLSSNISGLSTQFLKTISERSGPVQVEQIKAKQQKEEVLMLPASTLQMLSQGEIISLYTEDGRIKRFHMQIVKELNFVICKDVNALIAKEKYTMAIHEIIKMVKGYEKTGNSAFERGTGFFSKYPKPEDCFSLYSLTSQKGQKNFHFCFKDANAATRWFEAIHLVLRYKKSLYKKALDLRGK